jgi:hypothetical protein
LFLKGISNNASPVSKLQEKLVEIMSKFEGAAENNLGNNVCF